MQKVALQIEQKSERENRSVQIAAEILNRSDTV
jgi:hypothetical protein